MRLDGKVALVTGGAAGIGRGIVERFAEAGARVAVFDCNGEGAREAAHAAGGLAIEGDISADADAQRAVAETVDHFGALDILVNNAGIELYGTVERMAPEQWDRLLQVNLRGAYRSRAMPRRACAGGAA